MNPKGLYRPLSIESHEIRVLEVGSRLIQDRVCCALNYISLAEAIGDSTFDAISWCWGDSIIRSPIIVDNQKIQVPQNADELLRELVCRGISRIWLDAVCIDQDDIEERASQVKIMHLVYSKARRVIAWLGDDQGTGLSALRGLEALVRQYRDHTKDFPEDERQRWFRRGPRNVRYFTYDPLPEDLDWKAVRRLYDVAYLTRLWVIQEVSLAREPICFYGTYTLRWQDLGIAAEWMTHRSYERSEYIGKLVRGIMNTSIIQTVRGGARDMDKLLMSGLHFDTGEPRDKVFGLLGLIQSSPMILPDYKSQVANLFIEATKSAIRKHRRLRIVAAVTVIQATISDKTLNLPSWVPHYAAEWCKGPKGIRNTNEIGADNGRELVLDEQSPLNVLRVKGIVVATVATSTLVLTKDVDKDGMTLSMVIDQLWEDICRHYNPTCGKSTLLILYEALATWYEDSRMDGKEDKELPADFLAFFKQCQQNDPDSTTTGGSAEFANHIHISSLLRSFFVTTDGLAGQVTAQARRGDKICILFGNDSTFLLRPAQEGYKLVGVAHFASVMDGAYVRALEEGDLLNPEWFDIY